MKIKTYTFKGFTARLNPLTGEWLVDIGGIYGAYSCRTKARIRKIIDNYYRHKEDTENAEIHSTTGW